MTLIVPFAQGGFKRIANKCEANALRSMRSGPYFGLTNEAFRNGRLAYQRKTSSDGTSGDQED